MKIVCTVGLPATNVDALQRGGRAIQQSNDDALFVIFLVVEKFSSELQFKPEPSRTEPQVQFEVQKIS